MIGKATIKVMVIDDSALVRQTLSEILSADPAIEVVATASDPIVAAERLRKTVPDVITLDVEMPRMDGLTFLKKLMSQHPIPVVMCSSLTEAGSETALKALEYGAVEVIQKPRVSTRRYLEEARIRICDAVKAAARARPRRGRARPSQASPKLTADAMLAPPSRAMVRTSERVVAIGASTGGTEALRVVLEALPHDAPGLVIVQHMPEGFTSAFARRLDALCRIGVKEAEDNDTVLPGRALIAPGNRHMLLKRSGARYYVEVKDGPLVSRHRPSVDVLFRSVASYAAGNAVGVLLTGMGDDGAHGLRELRQAGAHTIAQDEASCVVYGMPKKAAELEAAAEVLSLEQIAAGILTAVGE